MSHTLQDLKKAVQDGLDYWAARNWREVHKFIRLGKAQGFTVDEQGYFNFKPAAD